MAVLPSYISQPGVAPAPAAVAPAPVAPRPAPTAAHLAAIARRDTRGGLKAGLPAYLAANPGVSNYDAMVALKNQARALRGAPMPPVVAPVAPAVAPAVPAAPAPVPVARVAAPVAPVYGAPAAPLKPEAMPNMAGQVGPVGIKSGIVNGGLQGKR